MEAPWLIRWISTILWTLPAPTEHWAAIVTSLVWPGVLLFLVLRFRLFIRQILTTLVARIKTDHIKVGPFELTPGSAIVALDPEATDESTEHYEPADVHRIEAMFEFMSNEEGEVKVLDWLSDNLGGGVDVDDFLTLPAHANDRARACAEIEGLDL